MNSDIGNAVIYYPYDYNNPYQDIITSRLESEYGYNIIRLKEYGDVRRLIEQSQSQMLIHQHWFVRPAAGEGWLLAKPYRLIRAYSRYCSDIELLLKRGHKIVWTVHNLYPHECKSKMIQRVFQRRLANYCHKIIAHSPEARKIVSVEYGISETNITIIPHPNYIKSYPHPPSRDECCKLLSIDPDKCRMLVIGTVRRYKNIPKIISAFRCARLDDSELIIAGKLPDNEKLLHREIVEHIGGYPDIVFREGYVSNHDISLYMGASDIVVMAHGEILTSGAVMLAMSFGKALVIPNDVGFRAVTDESGAFFFDHNGSNSLSHVLCQARVASGHLLKMGIYNKQKAMSLNSDAIAQQHHELYKKLLSCDE